MTLRALGALALAVCIARESGAQPGTQPPASTRTRNVVLVVTDGLRWQEVFGGADSSLVFGDPKIVNGDTAAVRKAFWRPTAEARRAALLPFLWSVVGREGQIFGNRNEGSSASVTNGLKFSYPGYNEMLSGFGDPRIDKNDYGINPNATVFEFLNRQRDLRGRVAAFATWDVFADIFARERSGVFVHAGWEPPYARPRTAADSLLNELYASTYREWWDNAWDSFAHAVAMRFLERRHPRVVFIGYGETDEWAHAGRYDRMLRSARAVDERLRELWTLLQSQPQYRGRTTMIVTTDHGRGRDGRWTDHGREVDGAEEMWIAVIGPDTPALGERRNAPSVTQAQIAATIAALLGFDYRREELRAAEPIGDVIRR
jgi:phosphopentomutase/2,3-bisphosphoglycerate-independent phosphoglycerate mutase family metalloenzyme